MTVLSALLSLNDITITHVHWYEVLFDTGVLIVGFMLGWLLRTLYMHRHLEEGFQHLSDVSARRSLRGPDIYTAFALKARQERRHLMRRWRERAAERSAPGGSG